jgi:hypothetical protein
LKTAFVERECKGTEKNNTCKRLSKNILKIRELAESR